MKLKTAIDLYRNELKTFRQAKDLAKVSGYPIEKIWYGKVHK